jgi:starch phosphorylase
MAPKKAVPGPGAPLSTKSEVGTERRGKRGAPVSPIQAFFPEEVPGFEALAELALDIHWYWNHSVDDVWKALDPDLWETTNNPWVVLQTASRERLRRVLADPVFRRRLDALVQGKRRHYESPGWFRREFSRTPLTSIAYFSMEFMLSEALPIYSGGLGNVAGDQLKTASDLCLPVEAVGLLYQQGYFRQEIDKNGAQRSLFPYNDPGQLPVTPLRDPNGEWLRLQLDLPGEPLWLRTWQVQVGRTRLYLLDSNDPANSPARRGITSELYGGGPELRLNQELVLGIGGWRLLRALGLKPEVCHLNEGHAAFAVLERARTFMEETGQPFPAALAATRPGNLFTTHTPVAAGFDRFAPALVKQYLGEYARNKLGLSLEDLLALGRKDPPDASEPFNMAYLAARGSGAVNGVSQLHGRVSRRIFAPLFPRWPEAEVPVGHVTNGVHMPSWDSAEFDQAWTEASGKDRWLGTMETLERDIRYIPDARLWELRTSTSRSFVEYVRRRLSRQLAASGAPPDEIAAARTILDPEALILGFARRFATYKRPNLLLHDPERLVRILNRPGSPAQLVIAGKAHPQDLEGQAMIQEWTRFIRRPEVRGQVVFLSDYDMLLTARMVQGVDVWINTPRRPWEACGTSGMKTLVNGGLNLSIRDGWWDEAYSPEVGWAIGDGLEHGDDPAADAADAEALYRLLEDEVVPEFYRRNSEGLPPGWLARMRESMARLTPRFSANRTVREYTERYYLPAAAAFRQRAADKGSEGAAIVEWKRNLEAHWSDLRFGRVRVETEGGQHQFSVELFLGSLDPESVRVELYAEAEGGADPVRQEMTRGPRVEGVGNGWLHSTAVTAARPAADYTPRVVPFRTGVSVPLELNLILWQR